MKDAAEYTFRIDDFTPKSMPFGRLVDYYAEIKKILGNSKSVHLVALFEGSHGSAFAIDPDYREEVEQNLTQINQGTASKIATRANKIINEMLKDDGTSGRLCNSEGENVIVFPGQGVVQSINLRVRDAANFVGELYHISGTQGDVKVRISTDTYGVVYCTTTRDIAKELGDFLFENVKVSGRGVWSRTVSGDWDISDFLITDFKPINKESLRTSIDKIRRLDIEWPEDTLGEIAAFDETNGVVQ